MAWVSLDESANAPTRFWIYVVEALRRAEPGVGAAALRALRRTSEEAAALLNGVMGLRLATEDVERLAAVDTAATRLQQLHPEVKLARLACGHAIPLERPRELADLIIGFAESVPARS
jgi:hypothetical protein